ncbi:MAG: arginine repressor [Lachnospiraceae bacterium]|nr:arginine repressor [Lachnospiraceae bacterium]
MKTARQNKILELVSKNEIATQEELADKLLACGFDVTQATVSRDIRELGLTKISLDGGVSQKYVAVVKDESTMNDKYLKVLKTGFVSMAMAQNILVIKTVGGMAMGVAAALDGLKWHEIVGSIAGDDTIMCAIRNIDDTYVVMEKLRKIVLE